MASRISPESPAISTHAPAPAQPEAQAVRAAFAPAAHVDAAEAFTRHLALNHYENFSVVSHLLPRHLRQDFCNVYAFCRLADDLADEGSSGPAALETLDRFRQGLRACYAGRAEGAVFLALRRTVERHDIPVDPFEDLISAFEQDQRVNRYDTFEQLLDYCRRSANPVGRLVLYVCGYRDERRQTLSDFTCTALQLANFWQDLRRDLRELNRVYLPRESMRQFGVAEEDLWKGRAGDSLRRLLRHEVDRAETMFAEGDALLPLLDPSVRRQVALFGAGGRALLQAIRRQGYDTLARRPVLSALQKAGLAARAVGCQLLGRRGWPARAGGTGTGYAKA